MSSTLTTQRSRLTEFSVAVSVEDDYEAEAVEINGERVGSVVVDVRRPSMTVSEADRGEAVDR